MGGWHGKQLPDGTVIFTSPSGRTYTTKPDGETTGELTLPDRRLQLGEGRALMMPRRKRTRAQEHQARISTERRINEQIINRQQWLADEAQRQRDGDEPPPF